MADLSPQMQQLFGTRFLPGYYTNAYGGYTSPWQKAGGPYDPMKFIPQGPPPATPGANADVANQSQIVRTADEVSQEMQRLAYMSNARAQKQTDRLADYYASQKSASAINDAYDKSSPSDITAAIQAVMGGKQDSISPGVNPNTGAAITSYYANNPAGSVAVPQDYIPANPTAQDYNITGGAFTTTPSRQLKGADAFARDTSQDIVTAIRNGQTPVIPQNLQGNQGITDAVAQFQKAYTDYQGLSGTDRVMAIRDQFANPQQQKAGFARIEAQKDQYQNALGANAQQFNQNTWNQANIQGQGYLDMMGGAFPGGVLPSALNPQWYDMTPTFTGADQISGDGARQAAANSPWGQPGAPFAAQAWANGAMQGQNFSGAPDSFSPMNFNPSLATNPPWGQPQQKQQGVGWGQPQGFGSNPMKFGSDAWGHG